LLAACITESPIANTPLGSLVPNVVVADTTVVVVAGATVVDAATVVVGDANVVVVVRTSAVVVVIVEVVVVATDVDGRGGSGFSGLKASLVIASPVVGVVSLDAERIVVEGVVIAGWAAFSSGNPQAVARTASAIAITAARITLIDPGWCLTTSPR
jgi:hypothetical protein